jgi:wyosine [tRNA(Phe)-imidazoG37] synthetase (radical SAM superfamily)
MSRVLDFADHRRDLGANRFVYAVVSRRARGLSIGVNLNPDKVCNFDCPYCQVDRTVPGAPPDVDVPVLRAELAELLALARGDLWSIPPFDTAAPALRRVVDIAFAGDGEPTAARAFAAAAAAAHQVRDDAGVDVPLRLLTNATLLHRPRVRDALPHFDALWCKLDAGTEDYYRVVDGTTFPFARVLANLRETAARRPIVIQSMFLTLDGVGPSDAEIAAWAARLAEIGNIEEVQVYTVARRPARPSVGPLGMGRLEAIAAEAAKSGFETSVSGP